MTFIVTMLSPQTQNKNNRFILGDNKLHHWYSIDLLFTRNLRSVQISVAKLDIGQKLMGFIN
jgi:hypothetical protein